MVSRHCKLREFIGDYEIGHRLLVRELIAQAHSVVENAEADLHKPVAGSLPQGHSHFVAVVADLGLLSPNRIPGLVNFPGRSVGDFEPVIHSATLEFEAQMALPHHRLALVVKRIDRNMTVFKIETEFHDPVRAGHFSEIGVLGRHQAG